MSRALRCALAASAVALASCGSSTDEADTAVSSESATTEVLTTEPPATEPSDTERPATTTAATTEDPASGFNGIAWESVVDPERNTTLEQPSFAGEGTGIEMRLQIIGTVDATAGTSMADECEAEIEFQEELENVQPGAASCLFTQIAFNMPGTLGDAPDGHPLETGTIGVITLTSPEGRQTEVGVYSYNALPGTIDNVVAALIPNGEPGSTLIIEAQLWSGGSGWEPDTWTLPTPPVEMYLPLDFD